MQGDGYDPGYGNVHVFGNLTVQGTINGRVINGDADAIQELRAKNTELQERVTFLESRIEQLWYAPGMPGAEWARTDFERGVATPRPPQNGVKTFPINYSPESV